MQIFPYLYGSSYVLTVVPIIFTNLGGICPVEKSKDPFISSQAQVNDILASNNRFPNVNPSQLCFNMVSDAEAEQLRREYIERAQRRIDIYRTNEQEHLEHVLRQIDEQRSDKLRRIKIAYDSNGTQWIDEIFKSIISVD